MRAQGRTKLGAENHGVKPLDFPVLSDENIAPDELKSAAHRRKPPEQIPSAPSTTRTSLRTSGSAVQRESLVESNVVYDVIVKERDPLTLLSAGCNSLLRYLLRLLRSSTGRYTAPGLTMAVAAPTRR